MDSHLIIKILHASFASLAFIVLLVRGYPILIQKNWQFKRNPSHKILVGIQHLSYSILVLSGLWLLWSNQFNIQPWFYAKIILFFVILSASAKAFKSGQEILLVQRQAGVAISIVAFCALLGLVILKPQFA